MYRKILFTIFTLVFSVSGTTAQNSQYLDKRAGFKQFELGEKVRMDSVKLRMTEPSKLQFTYKGNCCNDLFGYDIEKIVLGYDAKKEMKNTELIRIFVLFKSLGGAKENNETATGDDVIIPDFETEFQRLKDLKSKLETLFGEAKLLSDSEPIIHGWFGDKVYMLLYSPSNVMDGVVPSLEIGYRSYRENNLKSEF